MPNEDLTNILNKVVDLLNAPRYSGEDILLINVKDALFEALKKINDDPFPDMQKFMNEVETVKDQLKSSPKAHALLLEVQKLRPTNYTKMGSGQDLIQKPIENAANDGYTKMPAPPGYGKGSVQPAVGYGDEIPEQLKKGYGQGAAVITNEGLVADGYGSIASQLQFHDDEENKGYSKMPGPEQLKGLLERFAALAADGGAAVSDEAKRLSDNLPPPPACFADAFPSAPKDSAVASKKIGYTPVPSAARPRPK